MKMAQALSAEQDSMHKQSAIPIVERVRICDEAETRRYFDNLLQASSASALARYKSFDGPARSILPHPDAERTPAKAEPKVPKIDFNTAVPCKVKGTAMPGLPVDIVVPKNSTSKPQGESNSTEPSFKKSF